MPRRLRTFIAVDVGKTIRDRIAALQETFARSGADLKWVEGPNIHLTLIFMGEVIDIEVPKVCKVISKAMADFGPFQLSVESVGCFGDRRQPACCGSASARGAGVEGAPRGHRVAARRPATAGRSRATS